MRKSKAVIRINKEISKANLEKIEFCNKFLKHKIGISRQAFVKLRKYRLSSKEVEN